MEALLTVNEISKMLKISKAKIYYLIQRKQIPHIKIGRNVRVFESQLRQWLETLVVKC